MNKRKKTFERLARAASHLLQVVQVGGSELVRDARVQSGARELKKSLKGGQIDLERMALAVSLISEAACDVFRSNDEDKRQS